jgi:hypothetical protein
MKIDDLEADMRLTFCALCGATESLEHHHVIPLSDGGEDIERNILTACSGCHGVIHGMSHRADIGSLTKKGLARARETREERLDRVITQEIQTGKMMDYDTIAAAVNGSAIDRFYAKKKPARQIHGQAAMKVYFTYRAKVLESLPPDSAQAIALRAIGKD